MSPRFLILALLGGATLAPALAAPLPSDELERRCWLGSTRERTRPQLKELTLVDFSNLRNGFAVRTPFLVEFAVKGMGVVPAGKALAGSGHHHILINTRLPVAITDKLPFSDTHKHFGKGQTSTVLDLAPGKHTLRLLFADHEHRPHFVYSPEVTVEVTGPRKGAAPKVSAEDFGASCTAWYQDESTRPRSPGEAVYISNLRDGEPLVSPFNVRLAVDGWGICAKGVTADKCGHFQLDVLRGGKLLQSTDLANGATQTNLFLPVGSYTLRTRFVDGATGRALLPAQDIETSVTASERF
jgi:hypothetical protein